MSQSQETPLEAVKEQHEEQQKNSPLEQVREQQSAQQQALAEKEQEAKNHRPPPEIDPASNPKEHPQRQLG